MHKANNISISKVTHAGRNYTVQTAREYGADITSVKALGNWSESGSYRAAYDRALPKEALLGAAKFNANRPDMYHLPRNALR